MVDIGAKQVTRRTATAESRVRFPAAVAARLRAQGFATAKGPVFQTAIIAGVMAAKRTHELIPFCHPLGLERCDIDIVMNADDEAVIGCTTAVQHKTGVEMEALIGASIAALTIYDMCKALSHEMRSSRHAWWPSRAASATSMPARLDHDRDARAVVRAGAGGRRQPAHGRGQGGPAISRSHATRLGMRAPRPALRESLRFHAAWPGRRRDTPSPSGNL